MKHLRSNIAAAQIFNYLKAISNGSKDFNISEVEYFVDEILTKSDNSVLLGVLVDFGWNPTDRCFDNGDIDINGLTLALSSKSLQLVTRTSQMGPNLSPRSFLPGMLLNYLCCVLNQHEEAQKGASNDSFGEVQVQQTQAKASLSPSSFFFQGVCLLVDISGFTRLSGSYCAQGKEGIDGLRQATNGYMGHLVDVIYQYGGDIIKFAGDAIICVFVEKGVKESIRLGIDKQAAGAGNGPSRGVSRNPSSSTQYVIPHDVRQQAMVCATRLREISTEALTVHVALACGEMCFGMVGGFNSKFECLISGACLMEMSQCLDDTKSREVAVTSSFGDLVGKEVLEAFGATLLPSGNYLLMQVPDQLPGLNTNSREEEDAVVDFVIMSSKPEYMRLVNMFVPLPVSQAFDSSGLKYLGEIREVTTMFMKWDSYDMDRNKDINTLHDPFLRMQMIIAEQGGFIRQFLVDDKGCVLIACWGVHTASYLNNATRCLTVAVKIRDLFSSLSLQCSVGVTTGNVYCGNVGSEVRREYAAVGDVVNLSARLMSKAHGGIYIDENTRSRLSVTVWKHFLSLPPMQVKGKAEPIQAYAFDIDATIGDIAAANLEPSIEEYEIKQSCRTVLIKLLEKHTQTSENNDHNYASVRSSAIFPSPRDLLGNAATIDCCDVVYLEGKVGSGKATTVKWFVREAKKREIRVIRVGNIEQQDILLEYKVVSKLLIECIGPDVLLDGSKQRMAIMYILKAIYGEDGSSVPGAFANRSLAGNQSVISFGNASLVNGSLVGIDYIDKVALPVLRMILGSTIGANLPLQASESVRAMPYGAERSNSYLANKRLPLKLVCETIRDIVSFYLAEVPTVLIVENIHYADESSLKVLASLKDCNALGIIMFTSLPTEDLFANHRKASVTRRSIVSTDGTGAMSAAMKKTTTDSLESFKTALHHSARTQMVKLDDFNLSEIEGMIRSALKLETVPLGLAQWVQSLSGGSIYWINEMLEFIRSTGIDSFLSSAEPQNSAEKSKTWQKHSHSLASRHASKLSFPSVSPDRRSSNASASNSPDKHAFSDDKTEAGIETTSLLAEGKAAENEGSSSPSITQAKSNQAFSNKARVFTFEGKTSQLEHFIISRFERLPVEDQRILKKASVIGFEFSRYVLYGILIAGLKPQLNIALKNLMKEKWIVKAGEPGSGSRRSGEGNMTVGNDAEYMFAHEMAWDTLYNLIPPADRREIHQHVAMYYESMGSEDPALLEQISLHYSHSMPEKALEYALKASVRYLYSTSSSLQAAINALLPCSKFVQTIMDLRVLAIVLEAVKDFFYADYGQPIPEANTSQASAITRSNLLIEESRAVSFSEKLVPVSKPYRLWWLCCGRNTSTVVPMNVSHYSSSSTDIRLSARNTKRSSHSRFDSVAISGGGGGDGNNSVRSNLSHISLQSLNGQGREYIVSILHHMDRQIEKIYIDLMKEMRLGTFMPWQKDIIREVRVAEGEESVRDTNNKGHADNSSRSSGHTNY